MVIARLVGTFIAVGILALGVAGARAETKGCAEIVAAADMAGGSLSADELAKKLNTDVETVRNCLDKRKQAPKAEGGTAPAPMKEPTPRY